MQSKTKREEKVASQFLIIGGAPKSATTSLFHYLADHPQICPANRKETYFFAREFDRKKVCKSDETLESFEAYFTHCAHSHRIRVEATPYTLYSENSAQKIANLLPNPTVLFILRDPVERFLSNYHFQTQRGGHPAAQATLEEFIDWQLRNRGNIPNLLELGCYIEYLRPFFDAFERTKVFIMLFEEFKTNPVAEIQKLCMAMGVDAEFYSGYRFGSHNQTVNVRYSWLNQASMNLEPLVTRTRARLMDWPKVHRVFENAIGIGKSAYRALNDRGIKNREPIETETLAFLREYYRSHNQLLSRELGRPLPWKSFQQALVICFSALMFVTQQEWAFFGIQ